MTDRNRERPSESMRLLDLVRMDLAWVNIHDGCRIPPAWGWAHILAHSLAKRPFRAVLLCRLYQWLWHRRRRWLARYLRWRIFRAYHIEIAPEAPIAGGLRMPHPHGIIIGGEAELGPYVILGQGVTLGGNFGRKDEEGRLGPYIGKGTWVCAGCVVAGPIDVGEFAILGANSVVARSVANYAIMRGNPAELIRTRDPENLGYSLSEELPGRGKKADEA